MTTLVSKTERSHPTAGEQKWAAHGAVVVTTNSIEATLGSSAEATMVRQVLGPDGPLGSSGPASWLGPIGTNPWNVSYWSSAGGSERFRNWSRDVGPTSGAGPLADPDSFRTWVDGVSLRAGGELGVLGPDGVLGPRGAFGAAGPMGAHGFRRGRDGQYLDEAGQVQRHVTVRRADGTEERVDLVELYEAGFAAGMEDNDTTWVVRSVAPAGADSETTLGSKAQLDSARTHGDSYAFTVPRDQWLTLAVVPERREDAFRLTLTDREGRFLFGADSHELGNVIQLQVPQGLELRATVEYLGSSEHAPSSLLSTYVRSVIAPVVGTFRWLFGGEPRPERGAYRLYSVGSDEIGAPDPEVREHQRRASWLD